MADVESQVFLQYEAMLDQAEQWWELQALPDRKRFRIGSSWNRLCLRSSTFFNFVTQTHTYIRTYTCLSSLEHLHSLVFFIHFSNIYHEYFFFLLLSFYFSLDNYFFNWKIKLILFCGLINSYCLSLLTLNN